MSLGSERLAEDLKVETLTGPERALAEEAVRIKSRLDALDLWISGDHDTWFELATRWQGEAELIINAPLVEARQQGLALRSILAELARQGAGEKVAPPAPSKADELKAKREKRMREQSG